MFIYTKVETVHRIQLNLLDALKDVFQYIFAVTRHSVDVDEFPLAFRSLDFTLRSDFKLPSDEM